MNKLSDYLDNHSLTSQSPADRLLIMIKMRGPQTAAELGVALGVTDEAVRQQLLKLAVEGLVKDTSVIYGVGRPKQVWSLTPAGDQRFPDTHAVLTMQLISAVKKVLGEESLDRLISAREEETLANYQAEMEGASDLEERATQLAAIRDREGYMCELKKDAEGYLLIENHCPICAAATACLGFCHAELRTFKRVLGDDVEITREEHIVSGARRCAYRIRQTRKDARC